MKLRTSVPWMPAPTYARTLTGLSVNLLVRDVSEALRFQNAVLGARVVYSDPDFAVVEGFGAAWMFHADHAYENHAFAAALGGRGRGVELRIHGRDPDLAESAARELGFVVVAPARDKPHGLREAFLADSDGYVWVPDVPSG